MCTIFPLVLNSTRTVEFHILLHFLHLRKVPNTLTVNGKDEENNAKCSHYSSFKAKDIDRNTHWPVQKKKRSMHIMVTCPTWFVESVWSAPIASYISSYHKRKKHILLFFLFSFLHDIPSLAYMPKHMEVVRRPSLLSQRLWYELWHPYVREE